MPILTLQRRLREVGRIRMGIQVPTKNGRTRPEKLATFRLTSRDHQVIDAAASIYGGEVNEWTSPDGKQWEVVTTADTIPVIVPPGDMAHSEWMELWSAGGCQRRCDGVTEVIGDQPCLCDPDQRECNITTRLNVMLPDVPGFGLWRLESHGYYAAVELAGVVEMCRRATEAGHMLPARLRLEQRSVKRDGKTNRFAVPVLDLDVSVSALGALSTGQTLAVGELQNPDVQLPASGWSPVPVGELPEAPGGSVAEQVAAVNTPEPRKPRANAQAPIPATGLEPRTAAEVASTAGLEGLVEASGQSQSKVLVQARKLAGEGGVVQPTKFDQIAGGPLEALVVAWLAGDSEPAAEPEPAGVVPPASTEDPPTDLDPAAPTTDLTTRTRGQLFALADKAFGWGKDNRPTKEAWIAQVNQVASAMNTTPIVSSRGEITEAVAVDLIEGLRGIADGELELSHHLADDRWSLTVPAGRAAHAS